ncbi:hypothetical protein [Nostoc sp.]|uniref:hypothetical protein n=1 Tax=Nostoc sp. TaxID=1180 RepID=UPI002FFB5FFB
MPYSIRHKSRNALKLLVESMAGIIPRTSQLEPDVRLSPHPAPDVLSLRFCSCACSRGMTHVMLRGYLSSSWHDFHRCGAG